MKDKYIEECKIIQQNCTYTAEAHHQDALCERKKAIWLEVIPAACAAVTGTLVAAKYASENLLFVTIISSVITAVATVLNPRKGYESHLVAAKNFTAMKHDARLLHEAGSQHMSEEAFVVAVENLHERYNDLLQTVPPTSPKAFEKARNIIGRGIHEPDKDRDGKVR